MIKARMFSHLSSPLLLVILTLMGVGLVQVYSSSYVYATETYGDGLFFFKRQLLFVLLGFAVLFIMTLVPTKIFEKWGWLLWLVASFGVILTFVPGFGVRAGGAHRWLQLPFGFRFEPSELLKFSFVFLVAALFVRKENFLRKIPWLIILMALLAPLFLLLKQPDFGSFAIILFVGLGLLFAFGLKWRFIIFSLLAGIPTFYFLVMSVPYRRARMLSFLDPWADPEQKGFQVIQSMLSFHSGGLFGVGIGQGQSKLFFLPEAHTDFTLAVLGEEYGLVGILIVLALYAFLVLRSFQIAMKSDNHFYRVSILGIAMTFALSVFINSGVVMGMLPTKGLTLPFLSYGGSSLVVLCFIFGILLNIEKSITNSYQRPFLKPKTKIS
jgi:cell division protein FtsW